MQSRNLLQPQLERRLVIVGRNVNAGTVERLLPGSYLWCYPLGLGVGKEVPKPLHLLDQRGALVADSKGLSKCQMIASLNSTEEMSCTALLDCYNHAKNA